MRMEKSFVVPVMGFAGYSGSGKTTLITKVIGLLRQKGLRTAVLKHAHHSVDLDKPGKDSYKIREAGADQVLLASDQRWALMVENPKDNIPSLDQLLQHFDSASTDVILIEGHKSKEHPKIEVYRESCGHAPLYPGDSDIVAIATDSKLDTELPLLDINRPESVCEFIVDVLNLSVKETGGSSGK